jgi:hypothetical protein
VVPLLLLVTGLLVLRHLPRRTLAFRAAVGALVYLVLISAALVVWEVTGGALLEYSYYFSPLLPAMALCVGALSSAAASTLRSRRRLAIVGAAAAVAVIAPLVFLYYSDPIDRIGQPAYTPVAALAAVALISLVVGTRPFLSRVVATVLAVGLIGVVASSSYAFDGSADVQSLGRSSSDGGQTFDVSLDVVRFLHDSMPDDRLPTFWYDQTAEGGSFVGIQSLYYYAYTAIGFSMPKWDDHADEVVHNLDPSNIVLLCEFRGCKGAGRILNRHLQGVALEKTAYFSSGDEWAWVKVYSVGQLRPAKAFG